MKLFRLIFILLGLCLCLHHVWCLTCGTEYDDPASMAYLADIVVIGSLSQKLPAQFGYYNATVKVGKKKNILKGESILKSVMKKRGALITVGKFGREDPERCVTEVENEREYLLFLNTTLDAKYFQISALPIHIAKKKDLKRPKKDIKKILCSKSNCVKTPVINPKRMRDRTIDPGDKIDLNCRLSGRPFPTPVIQWLKDGVDIEKVNPKASIKSSKRGSRLTIRKTSQSDAGTYTCVAKNVGGEVSHDAVIKIKGAETDGTRPEVGDPALEDVEQKFQEQLRLTCKIETETEPKTRFKWFKDGKEIKNGDKEGLVIKTRKTESRLQVTKTMQSDEGIYVCEASNENGKVEQKSNVTVVGAPKKTVPCGEEDAAYCLNNGTCRQFVELGTKFCTLNFTFNAVSGDEDAQCKAGYKGERCMELTFDKIKERKLAQDRTFVVVGIISGILLFIGICVVSYFLAKRRRDRFHRRRRQRANGNIEDNIPQVYRPLIPCDDTDGHIKKMNGVLIHKEVQTIETCFMNSGKNQLYISPFESYVNEAGDRNSRSRRTAVSLDGDPTTKSIGPESDDENNGKHNNKGGVQMRRERPVSNASRNSNGLNFDGAPNDALNDLSPKRKSMQGNKEKPVSSKPTVVNIPSPKSQVPVINLDSDSEEDFPVTDSLPALHITDEEEEEEDNTDYIFKKCKVKSKPSSKEQKQKNIASTKDNRSDRKGPANDAKEEHRAKEQMITKPKPEEQHEKHKALKSPDNLIINTPSANNDSDSSTTTEGCDSPNTAWQNAQDDFSDQSPTAAPRTTWNERGSPETVRNPDNYFNIFPKMESRHSASSTDRNRNEHRNEPPRGKLKNKYTIVI